MRDRGFPLSGGPTALKRYPEWNQDTREQIAEACESFCDDFYRRNGTADDAMITSDLERLYDLVIQR